MVDIQTTIQVSDVSHSQGEPKSDRHLPQTVNRNDSRLPYSLMPNSPTSELTHRTWDYPVQNFLGAFTYVCKAASIAYLRPAVSLPTQFSVC